MLWHNLGLFHRFSSPGMTIKHLQVSGNAIQMISVNSERWALSCLFPDKETKAQRRQDDIAEVLQWVGAQWRFKLRSVVSTA